MKSQGCTNERHRATRSKKNIGENDPVGAPSCSYHARGTERIPRENDEDRECREQCVELVSISSAGALDMTHRDFSVRSEREEMRHIIGSSEPHVTIGSDKDKDR